MVKIESMLHARHEQPQRGQTFVVFHFTQDRRFNYVVQQQPCAHVHVS